MARVGTRPDWTEFETFIGRYMDLYGVPGVAVGVAVHGEPVYFKGFGYRDRERGLPVTDKTIFGIGSVTKSLTGLAVMQLEEQGMLTVADPVRKYLPDFRIGSGDGADLVKIHHFLTHTTGMPPLPTLFNCMLRSIAADPSLAGNPIAEVLKTQQPVDNAAEMMAYIARLGVAPMGLPGALYSYWNEGYGLLGTIIETVTGKRYEDYVTEHILKPTGMEASTFDQAEMLARADVTTIYAQKPGTKAPGDVAAAPVWWDGPAMTAAGFLRSSVQDMLRYMEIYRNLGVVGATRLASERSISRMMSPHVRMSQAAGYGYGLTVQQNYHGVSLVEHSGGGKGISAYISVVPERDITAVFLSNLSGVPSGPMLLGAINTVLGLPVATPRQTWQAYDCPPAKLPLYAGTYPSGEGVTVKVTPGDGALNVEVEGETLVARPVGVDTFLVVKQRKDEIVLRFLMSESGEYSAVNFGSRIVPRA